MATQDETRKLLAHVADRLGGAEVLASKLGISSTVLTLYIAGDRLVPDPLILRVVDLVLDETEATKGAVPPLQPEQPASPSPLDAKRDP